MTGMDDNEQAHQELLEVTGAHPEHPPVDYTTPHPFSTSLFRALRIDPNTVAALRLEITGTEVPSVWVEHCGPELLDGVMVTEPRYYVVELDEEISGIADRRLVNEVVDEMTGRFGDDRGLGYRFVSEAVEGTLDTLARLGYRIARPAR